MATALFYIVAVLATAAGTALTADLLELFIW